MRSICCCIIYVGAGEKDKNPSVLLPFGSPPLTQSFLPPGLSRSWKRDDCDAFSHQTVWAQMIPLAGEPDPSVDSGGQSGCSWNTQIHAGFSRGNLRPTSWSKTRLFAALKIIEFLIGQTVQSASILSWKWRITIRKASFFISYKLN